MGCINVSPVAGLLFPDIRYQTPPVDVGLQQLHELHVTLTPLIGKSHELLAAFAPLVVVAEVAGVIPGYFDAFQVN
jgi:hypothetical protein